MEGKLGFYYQTDGKALLTHVKQQEKQLQLRRRWLLGLPFSKSHHNNLFQLRSLPESFLRDDEDIFCETLKKRVEQAFGTCNAETEDHIQETAQVLDKTEDHIQETDQMLDKTEDHIQETDQVLDKTVIKRILSSNLDAFTNNGLYRIALLLTRGSVNFAKTHKHMKKVIKESLPKVLGDKNYDCGGVDFLKELSKLLNNPENVRENYLTSLFPAYSHCAAAIKILNGLEDMSTETLLAMYKRLKGIPACVPQLQKTRLGWSRETLLRKLRKSSKKMLAELDPVDELPAPLAKALAIASLSLKLTPGCPSSTLTDFDQFSPATKALQNEIAKAILLIKTKVRLPELKALQLLLDPKADVSNGCLRTSLKKLLTEYLFGCSDLDIIPKSLIEALTIINRDSRNAPSGFYFKEEIEKEVECILDVSAQAKQIAWDLLPDGNFDEEFTDAYVEELEESDEGDDDKDDRNDDEDDLDVAATAADKFDHQQFELRSSRSQNLLDHQEASIGENILVDPQPPIYIPTASCSTFLFQETRNANIIYNVETTSSTSGISGDNSSPHSAPTKRSNRNLDKRNEPEKGTTIDADNLLCTASSNCCLKSAKQSVCNNLYLGIQEACDEMSTVAYNLMGLVMAGMAQEEGLDLPWGDRSYLTGDSFGQEHQEEKQDFAGREVTSAIILRAVEELLPSFPKRGMDRLKNYMGE